MSATGNRKGGGNGPLQQRHSVEGRAPRTMRAPQAIAIVVATLLLAALLNADSLIRDTQSKPFGESRDRWMTVWRPFERTGDVLLLDRPRAAIDDITGQGDGPNVAMASASPEAGRTPTMASGGATVAPRPAPVVVLPTPTPQPAVRPASPVDPLRLWVGGDSLAIRFGESLVRLAEDTGMFDSQLDARISTGLARPDYFNWPGQLSKVSSEEDPDIMVMLFGSNDSQGLMDPAGDVYSAHSDGWRAEYRRRVETTLDTVAAPDRLVVWVGLPPMRDGEFSQRLADIDRIYREAAAAHEGVLYVDTWSLFSDDHGQYVAYLDDGGNVAQVREPDGVHLTRAGGDRLAEAVMDAIDEHVELAPSATSRPE